jgi:hypothetical protein
MVKILTIFMLLLISTNVFAEWTYIGNSDNFNSYVDMKTIRNKGNKAKMWYLFDYKTAQITSQNNEFWSALAIDEYDCTDGTSRTLSVSFLSGKMNIGQVVFKNDIKGEFKEIPPGSIIERIFKIACGIK